MIETTIREYLVRELNTDNVYLETPKPMPGECIVFTIVDRSRENLVDAVTVEIMSYAESKFKAAELDDKVRKAMYEFMNEYNISSSKLGGGNDAQDTSLKRYRYRSYFNVVYMEDM